MRSGVSLPEPRARPGVGTPSPWIFSGFAALFGERKPMDRPSFESIFAEYAPRVRAYFIRHRLSAARADEVSQEVMLTLWHHTDSFDPSKGSMSTWVFAIARNRLVDTVRRERRPAPDPEDPCWVEDRRNQAPSPEAATGELGRARRLRAAVNALPAEQRRVLEGLYFEGQSMSEFAAATGIPLGTVKSRARLALRTLRERIAEETEE